MQEGGVSDERQNTQDIIYNKNNNIMMDKYNERQGRQMD